ncbi:MAG: ribonucleoside-diphosphate reductase subunit alpha, partial [Verrucomicrobia bacterium]|nr:ribonucleoside-diphosphate reductase subunit alpha [Verrucomicrobiota bacterium]
MTSQQLSLNEVDPLANKRFEVCKRDGRMETFDQQRIILAIERAFKAERDLVPDDFLGQEDQHAVNFISDEVVQRLISRAMRGETLEIELVQDAVEVALMKKGHHAIARRYIIYREDRRKARALRNDQSIDDSSGKVYVTLRNGHRELLEPQRIKRSFIRACRGFEERCDSRSMAEETLHNLYDGVRIDEIEKAMIFSAKTRIEIDPAYGYVTARLLLESIYREVIPAFKHYHDLNIVHAAHFTNYLEEGIREGRLTPALREFDLKRLAAAM